ncbi:hypothetical protein D9613_012189 [Agrocybe pediades]|uniref:C3H1-type domain-containing protein n=1 Tax=Agrocybe pediades TaxID=84607 RepID=A0A8H4VTQ3_9AGAR|nr:hypothetical protein D9613_012189 [Agrocybe pediades]
MGITGLWEIVNCNPPLKRVSRELEAVGQGQSYFPRWGVDMSILMAECTGATFAAGVNGQFEGGALRLLFNRLCQLASLLVTLVFVYDGAGRPSIKNEHSVVDSPLWWVNHSKVLVQAFGYHVHEAPGEAEAELAMLNQLGMIDAVVTNNDSDAILFGAIVIYKSIPRDQREYDNQVLKYDAGDAEDEIGFSKGTALLIALMAGGDYDRRGIYGCGFMVARDLAKCGFGDSLIEAYERLRDNHFHDFTGFMGEWRVAVRLELCSNARGNLSQRCPAVAASIPDSFPSVDILDLYLKPLTSSSMPAGVPDHGRWIHREISFPLIVQFCMQHFGWTALADLRQHFDASLWVGIFLRMVYLPIAVYDPSTGLLTTPDAKARILAVKLKERKGQYCIKYGNKRLVQLSVSTSNFEDTLERLVPSLSSGSQSTTAKRSSRISVWLPFGYTPRIGLFPHGFIPQTDAVLPTVESVLDPAHPLAVVHSVIRTTRAAGYALESAVIEHSNAEPESRRALSKLRSANRLSRRGRREWREVEKGNERDAKGNYFDEFDANDDPTAGFAISNNYNSNYSMNTMSSSSSNNHNALGDPTSADETLTFDVDVLTSIFGSTIVPSELEDVLAANGYDLERAMGGLSIAGLVLHLEERLPRSTLSKARRVQSVREGCNLRRGGMPNAMMGGSGGMGLGGARQQGQQQQAPRYANGCVVPGANRVCRYTVAGECWRADCRFSQDLERALCHFWLRGTCAKQENCKFLHQLPKDVDMASLNAVLTRANLQPGTGPLAAFMGASPYNDGMGMQQDEFPALRYDGAELGDHASAKGTAPRNVLGSAADNLYHPLAVVAPRASPRISLRSLLLLPTLPTGGSLSTLYMSYRSRALHVGSMRNTCLPRREDGASAKWFSKEGQAMNETMREEMREAAAGLVRERVKVAEGAVRGRDAGWSDDPGDRGTRGCVMGAGLGVCLGVGGRSHLSSAATSSGSLPFFVPASGTSGGGGTELMQEERMEAMVDLHGRSAFERGDGGVGEVLAWVGAGTLLWAGVCDCGRGEVYWDVPGGGEGWCGTGERWEIGNGGEGVVASLGLPMA